MSWLQAAILGLVEGVTEYLPVSSTGHLILVSALLGLDSPPELERAVDAFNIIIQGGAILAVLGLYWPRVEHMLRGLTGRDPAGLRLLGLMAVAFLPAGLLGPLLDDAIEDYLFSPVPVVAALALGGVAMILVDPWQRRRFGHREHGYVALDALGWRAALAIGLFQCLAMWPGTSRSMVTIVAGMVVGMRPRDSAEFSFLLALPTLGGACIFKLGEDLLGEEPSALATLGTGSMAVGMLVATLSAALAVRWLVTYLNRHGLAVFGWYRLALSVVFAGLSAGGWLAIG